MVPSQVPFRSARGDPSTVLADAAFTIDVGAPPSDTPEPVAGGAYGGTWVVSYTNTEERQHTGGTVPAYMNVPLTMELAIDDSQVTDNGNGSLTIVVGGLDNYTLVGAADGSISGTITETYGQGQHWIKGTFRMTRK